MEFAYTYCILKAAYAPCTLSRESKGEESDDNDGDDEVEPVLAVPLVRLSSPPSHLDRRRPRRKMLRVYNTMRTVAPPITPTKGEKKRMRQMRKRKNMRSNVGELDAMVFASPQY